MRERPLVYLVPPMAAALYAAVCLELPVQLHIIAPIALLLVLAAVFLRRRKCLLNVFAVLAAAALALTGFAVFRDLRVVPIRALAGETQEITATALRDAEVYDTDQRVLLSLPADLAEKIMATALFADRRQDVDVRHTSVGRAAEILADLDE